MSKRKKHPSKAIELAVQYAENRGWRYKEAGYSAHAWRRLLCSFQSADGCQMSVWSTPRSAENHAKQIRRIVDRCEHNTE